MYILKVNLLYDLTEDVSNMCRFFVLETWASQEAVDAHNGTPHFRTFEKACSQSWDGSRRPCSADCEGLRGTRTPFGSGGIRLRRYACGLWPQPPERMWQNHTVRMTMGLCRQGCRKDRRLAAKPHFLSMHTSARAVPGATVSLKDASGRLTFALCAR